MRELDWGPCEPGTLEQEDGSCLAAGVPEDGCGEGFEHDGDAGCAPILPADDDCAPGMTALPGDRACRLLRPCPTEPWGDIPVEPDTLYVDAAFTGTPDGSVDAPFVSIQEAIDAASPGVIVAVAAGTYAEELIVDQPIRLWGVCPTGVSVAPQTGSTAVTVTDAGTVEIHAIGITHPAAGVSVNGASQALLSEVWVHDVPGGMGIAINATEPVVLRDVVVETVSRAGINLIAGTVDGERIEVRDVSLDDGFGYGIAAGDVDDPNAERLMTLRRVRIRDVRDIGILVQGADATVEDSLIEDVTSGGAVFPTLPRAGLLGIGDAVGGHAVGLRRSVVRTTMAAGVFVLGVDLELRHVTVSDLDPGPDFARGLIVDPYLGVQPNSMIVESAVKGIAGVAVRLRGQSEVTSVAVRDGLPSPFNKTADGIFLLPPNDVSLRGVLVEDAIGFGMNIAGGNVTLSASRVSNTGSPPDTERLGAGIAVHPAGGGNAFPPVHAELSGLWVDGNAQLGVGIAGDGSLTNSLVEGTTANALGQLGDGVVAISFFDEPAELATASVHDTITRGNERAGLATFGATSTVGETDIACNGINLNGESLHENAYQLEVESGVHCFSCEGPVTCKVLSSTLEPPPSPEVTTEP
jgi:hypothetical protein